MEPEQRLVQLEEASLPFRSIFRFHAWCILQAARRLVTKGVIHDRDARPGRAELAAVQQRLGLGEDFHGPGHSKVQGFCK